MQQAPHCCHVLLSCLSLKIRRAGSIGRSCEAHESVQSKGSAVRRAHQGNASTPKEYFLKGSPPGAPPQGSEIITPQLSRYSLLVAAHSCPALSCTVHQQPAGVFIVSFLNKKFSCNSPIAGMAAVAGGGRTSSELISFSGPSPEAAL